MLNSTAQICSFARALGGPPPFAVLLIALVFSLLALFPARSPLAITVPLLILLGVGAALLRGSAMTGGVVDTTTLPAGGADAQKMAGKTGRVTAPV